MTPQDTVNKLREEIEKECELFSKYWEPYSKPIPEASRTLANRIAALTARALVGEKEKCDQNEVDGAETTDDYYSIGFINGSNSRISEEQVLADLIEKL